MKTTCLCNQKGGVSKTTTAAALASGLAHRGYKVLAVDLDPQSNLSYSSGADPMTLSSTIFDIFKEAIDVKSCIIQTDLGYDLLPGGLDLAGSDMDFTQTGREYMLKEALMEISDVYDYTIIDTPPTLGILTINALTASDSVIVPLTADVYAMQGLAQLDGLIGNVRRYCNADLRMAGLLITKYKGRQKISKALTDQIDAAAKQLGTKVYNAKIRESVAIREAQLLQSDIFADAPKANATIDYNNFVDEFLEEAK